MTSNLLNYFCMFLHLSLPLVINLYHTSARRTTLSAVSSLSCSLGLSGLCLVLESTNDVHQYELGQTRSSIVSCNSSLLPSPTETPELQVKLG